MKRWLKITLLTLVSLIALVSLLGWLMHEKRPQGSPGSQAEALTEKMLRAVDAAAWDSIEVVSWNFGDRNLHIWDKKRHYARVQWGSYDVLVDIDPRIGIARKNGQIVTGKASQKLVNQAWHRWANDSFWLNPIVKAVDPGTERSLIRLEDGSEALLVTYTRGGATPGDSYLWIVDENGRPTHWKMWVNILPVGGLQFSWENWLTLPGGAQVATLRKGLFNVPIKDIKSGKIADVAPEGDPFAALEAI